MNHSFHLCKVSRVLGVLTHLVKSKLRWLCELCSLARVFCYFIDYCGQ
jgi:hypothetical protein